MRGNHRSSAAGITVRSFSSGRRRFDYRNTISEVNAPPLLVDLAVMRPAEGDEVVELGAATVGPIDDVVGVGPRRFAIAAREAAPWSRRQSAVRRCAGTVRVARSTESGTGGVFTRVHAAPPVSAGGATVTTLRTASQAIRRAVAGWIGPTSLNTAGTVSASASARSVSRLTVA